MARATWISGVAAGPAVAAVDGGAALGKNARGMEAMPTVRTPLSPPCIEVTANLFAVPVLRGEQPFADEVRRAMHLVQPRMVLVDFPVHLGEGLRALVHALPHIHVLAWRAPDGRVLSLLGDPCDPMVEAVRLADEFGLPFQPVDVESAAPDLPQVHLPDSHAVSTLGARVYYEQCAVALGGRPAGERDRVIAARLAHHAASGERLLYIGELEGLATRASLVRTMIGGETVLPPGVGDSASWKLLPLTEEQVRSQLLEIPWLAWLYENFRAAHGPEERFPWRDGLQKLLLSAAGEYESDFDEEIPPGRWKLLFNYARRLSRVRGRLRPRFYELVISAKSCVDGDFGISVYRQARRYPPNEGEDPPEERRGRARRGPLELHGEFDGVLERFCPAYPCPDSTEVEITFRRRPPTALEEEQWRRGFLPHFGICSWPPEDEFIEKFFRMVRRRALEQIGDAHTVVEKFQGSLLDGLDLRETMRRVTEGGLYVRRERRPPGKVGPVVVLWNDAPFRTRRLWRTTLYAENNNESDIAIYTSLPGRRMAGPGITRVEYHGVLSVYPARGIPDMWSLPQMARWRTCGRALIAAAILLSEERFIAVVSSTPPDMELIDLARRFNRALIHLPLGQFSRKLLRRARRCHVLESKQARQWAADYIEEDD